MHNPIENRNIQVIQESFSRSQNTRDSTPAHQLAPSQRGRNDSPQYAVPTHNRHDSLQHVQYRSPDPHRDPPVQSRPWRGRGRGRGRGKGKPTPYYNGNPQWEGGNEWKEPYKPYPNAPNTMPHWEPPYLNTHRDAGVGAEGENFTKREN